MGLFCTLDLPKPIPMKNKLIQGINFSAGGFLFILGIMGYIYPEWFFQEKYDVLMPTPQSTTILRVMMGFMATIGLLWLWATRYLSGQRRFFKSDWSNDAGVCSESHRRVNFRRLEPDLYLSGISL